MNSRAELACQCLERGGTRSRQHDLRALTMQGLGNRPADPAGGSGYQPSLARQIEQSRHLYPMIRSAMPCREKQRRKSLSLQGEHCHSGMARGPGPE
jgi:hypothetical protein